MWSGANKIHKENPKKHFPLRQEEIFPLCSFPAEKSVFFRKSDSDRNCLKKCGFERFPDDQVYRLKRCGFERFATSRIPLAGASNDSGP
jgi:hypothetical protein